MGIFYFLAAVVLLLLGYAIYGVVVEKIFGIDPKRPTCVHTKFDGIDYVPLPAYKIFFIQLLNIAGLGPVFGPILGALYGPSALLWVVFGTIFAGAVHDFLSGAMSLRLEGATYPDVIGRNLGPYARWLLLIFTIWFMILVGAVFVNGPAGLLAYKSQQLLASSETGTTFLNFLLDSPLTHLTKVQGEKAIPALLTLIFASIIFIYYFLATILPIDKIIGHVYPIFAILLLVMAVGLLLALFFNQNYEILPNIHWQDFFTNKHPKHLPLWPLIFVTIACGAIS
ncbi:MAG: carbon starvation protein A, partial [Desulfovibrio sp.]|nr:carbon starvation protein A [Desulfovibrio sp.]